MTPPILIIFFGAVGLVLLVVSAVLVIAFIVVPLFKGIGHAITALFTGIGFIVRHVVGWLFGTVSDVIRLVGAIVAAIVLLPIMLIAVLVGRWSAASHYAASVVAETRIGGLCLYRACLRRPLKLLFLDGLVEGLEQRIPMAIENAPITDLPRRGVPSFVGYTIVGSLRAGGSGAKLHVAEPDEALRRRRPELPEKVVIKSFAISEGSALPQIVRESRALDAARQLGLVLDHGIDANRFFYVMPYHQGDNLGVHARRLHGESGGDGLTGRTLHQATSLVADLVDTLTTFHAGGLWHKDIKPENIMVHGDRAHVVDLGLVTPLRSAMTLTTHGTEYFRDPEMVRMALRGVKVHQVDGAKFDIYAAGAVLYFVLENTFPAHGGLSAFAKSSPESLRWIVRRAMAEYGQRYATAEVMLADLRAVLGAADPYAVRPAELPSMRGGESPQPPMPGIAPRPASVGAGAAAGPGVGFGAGAGAGAGVGWAAAARESAGSVGAAGAGVAAVGRGALTGSAHGPRLVVTDWLSGTYDEQPVAFHMPNGQSARQQREVLRQRAHAAAQAALARARRPRDPSMALILLTVLSIAVIIGLALVFVPAVTRSVAQATTAKTPVTPPVPSAPGALAPRAIAGVPLVGTDGVQIVGDGALAGELTLRVLLINAHPSLSATETMELTETALPALADEGIEVVVDDPESAATLTIAIGAWSSNRLGGRERLEHALRFTAYDGVLVISASEDNARSGRARRAALELIVDAERVNAGDGVTIAPSQPAAPLPPPPVSPADLTAIAQRYRFRTIDATTLTAPAARLATTQRMIVVSTVPPGSASLDATLDAITRDFGSLGITTVADDIDDSGHFAQRLLLWADGVARSNAPSTPGRAGLAELLATTGYDGVIWVHRERTLGQATGQAPSESKPAVTVILAEPTEAARATDDQANSLRFRDALHRAA